MKDTESMRYFMVTKMIPENPAFELRPTNCKVIKRMVRADSRKTAIARATLYDFGDGDLNAMNCRYEVEEWDMTGEVTRAYVDQ